MSTPTDKRLLDLALGVPALVASVPIFLAVAAAMRATGDRGPLFHRARRVGEDGRLITVWKLRSMRTGAAGPAITGSGDPRVTRVGRVLRRTKLDELPQLWNVVRGEMSLVGPRPEDPKYVDWTDELHRRVFSARPGITGPAQLEFRHEERLLAGPDAERRYRDEILPAKLALDHGYLETRSLRTDLAILGRTIMAVVRRPRT